MHATRLPTATAATCFTPDELGHLLRWAAAAPDRLTCRRAWRP